MRLLGALVLLVILAIGGLVGYSYFGDMSARTRVMSVPVPLELPDAAPASDAEPAEADTNSTDDNSTDDAQN